MRAAVSWRSNRLVIAAATIIIVGLELFLVRRNLGAITLTTPIYVASGAVWLLCAWHGPLPTWGAAAGVLAAGTSTGTALTTSPDGVLSPLGFVLALAIATPARPGRALLLAGIFGAALVLAYSAMRALHGPLYVTG